MKSKASAALPPMTPGGMGIGTHYTALALAQEGIKGCTQGCSSETFQKEDISQLTQLLVFMFKLVVS